MKALLTFVASLFCVIGVHAASPSFSSFFPNHFLTNNLIIKANLNPTQFDTNASTVTITITNVSGVAGLLWTNDTSIGSSGRLMPVPGLDYAYVYPSNFYNHGWFSLQPEFHLLGSGTNTIGVEESSHLMFSMTNDPTEVIITLESGFAMGQELLLMSYTNTVFNGRFTLPADSVVSGGGLVKLNNNEDWLGANGSAIRLIWIEPDWWEQGRWTAGSNVTADVIWANVAGVIQPRGGQITNALQFISGSANAATNTLLTLDTVNVWTTDNSKLLDLRSVGTNVAYVTPSGSFESGRNVLWGFPSRDDILVGVHDASLGESSYAVIYTAAIDGNTETNYSEFGATLNTGASPASVLLLSSVATNLVASFNMFLQPDQGVANIVLVDRNTNSFIINDSAGYNFVQKGWLVGQDAPDWWGNTLNGETIVGVQNVGEGDPNNNEIYLATVHDSNDFSEYHLTVTTNSVTQQLTQEIAGVDSAVNSIVDGSGPRITITTAGGGLTPMKLHPGAVDGALPYIFDTSVPQTLGPFMVLRNSTTNALTFGPDARITFGVGTTNALFRSGTDFVFENDDATGFDIRMRSVGGDALYGVTSAGSPLITSDVAGQPVYMRAGGQVDGLIVTTDSLQPGTETMQIGVSASNGAWVHQFFKGTLHQQGLNDGSGNSASLDISHDNATGIFFNSAALGTGVARDFVFQDKGTNVARITVGDGLTNAVSALNIAGDSLSLTFTASGVPTLQSSTSTLYLAQSGGAGYLFLNNSAFGPNNPNVIDSGKPGSEWKDGAYLGTLYVEGFNSGTNYSRLAISHGGTNSTVFIDTQADGTAGLARPIQFRYGTTNIMKIDTTSAAGETRLWLYDEDNGTMERVTVGAADSGGVGFKLLRIPN